MEKKKEFQDQYVYTIDGNEILLLEDGFVIGEEKAFRVYLNSKEVHIRDNGVYLHLRTPSLEIKFSKEDRKKIFLWLMDL